MASLDLEDDDDSNTSSAATDNILNGLNGGTTSRRSISNTVRENSRLTSTSTPSVNGGSSNTLGRHHHSQSTRNPSTSSQPHHHHHNSSRRNDGERISSASSSTSTAKESFLNYFFGQNGPGPVAGANITNTTSEVHGHLNRAGGTVGRDVSGPDSLPGAFMRTKNGPAGDGSDPAFDMKSLGKHIEAVSPNFLSPHSELLSCGGLRPTVVNAMSHPSSSPDII
jgi:dynamin 1-like protein